MLEMNLYPIMGLYQELYNPDLLSMSEPLGVENDIDIFKNINSFFWSHILSEKIIDSLLNILEEQNEFIINIDYKYMAVLNNPQYFKR